MERTILSTSHWYSVCGMKYDFELSVVPTDDLAETKRQIDDVERRAVEQGYPPTKYLIVYNKTNTIYKSGMNGEDERFHYQSTTREAIGIYDAGTITFFDGRDNM